MAMVLAEPKLITGEELLTMSDIGPCELLFVENESCEFILIKLAVA